MAETETQWRRKYKELEAKAAELLTFLESVPASANETDLATLIDSNRKLLLRITRAVYTIDDRGS